MYLVCISNYNVLSFTKKFEALTLKIHFKHKGTLNKAQYDFPLTLSKFIFHHLGVYLLA